MNKHIPTFKSFVNEEVNEKIKSDFKPGDKVGLISISTKKKFDSGVVSSIQKDGNVVVVDTNFIGEVVMDPKFLVKESIDVKYWSDYNDNTSGQGEKEHEVKSKDFEDTFEDAVSYWNQEAEGAENRVKGANLQRIKKLAKEFFKQAGWISVNVVQAMIMQESY